MMPATANDDPLDNCVTNGMSRPMTSQSPMPEIVWLIQRLRKPRIDMRRR